MFDLIKKWWKFSSFRFYVLNAKWNYTFWLQCSLEYKIFEYYHFPSQREEPVKINKKRFLGYKFNGQIYLTNPGLPIKERDVWECWHKKGLI